MPLNDDFERNFDFSFDIEMSDADVRSNGIDLLSGGAISSTSELVNFEYSASSSGSFTGPLTAGSRLLTYEFEVLETGTIQVTSFDATFNGEVQPDPPFPEIDLENPGPLEADMIAGDFEVGQTLSLDTSTLPDFGAFSADTLEYTWFRDGTIVQIGEADAATYLVTEADEGAVISLRIAYFDNQFTERVVLSSDEEVVGDGPEETIEAYPPGTSTLDFATTVYNNVLGRTPDEDGLNFWVRALDGGGITREGFIREVIQGAKAPIPPDVDEEFIAQQEADRAYLETKTDIGAYFAVHLGMSDRDNAITVMDLFDGFAVTEIEARDQADAFYAEALDATTGEFLLPVVGVITDTFDPNDII